MLTDDLLELQRIDTTTDQLTHRRAHLPERAASTEASGQLRANRQRRAAAVARDGELEQAIGGLERDGEALTTHRTRLEAQLKTVIAPREAEALMHELATIAERRDALDDQELGFLDEQSELAGEVARLDDAVPELEAAATAAAATLAAAEASITAELTELATERAGLVGGLDAAALERYEFLRSRLGGVAVAKLDGSRCSGCHLDLSRSELDAVKHVGAGEFADCPQCGRLLVP
ncbi:MAG: C4-type zinc ribbon domain-containing protein [Ilumatobacteraceae bacterium]